MQTALRDCNCIIFFLSVCYFVRCYPESFTFALYQNFVENSIRQRRLSCVLKRVSYTHFLLSSLFSVWGGLRNRGKDGGKVRQWKGGKERLAWRRRGENADWEEVRKWKEGRRGNGLREGGMERIWNGGRRKVGRKEYREEKGRREHRKIGRWENGAKKGEKKLNKRRNWHKKCEKMEGTKEGTREKYKERNSK